MFRGIPKKNEKGKPILGKPFILAHCYIELEHEAKWKYRDMEIGKKKENKITTEATINIEEDEASSDDGKRSPTPNSSPTPRLKDQLE